MSTTAWIVRHRDGTCALKHQRRSKPPAEGVSSVPTLCGHFITLPYGFGREEPTCAECLDVLNARATEVYTSLLEGNLSTVRSGNPWHHKARGAACWGKDDFVLWDRGEVLRLPSGLTLNCTEAEARAWVSRGVKPVRKS